MSVLYMDELFSNVVFAQTLNIKKDVSIAYIRPWIYKEGTLVDGEFTCRVKDGTTIIKEVSIDYSAINEQIPQTYAHGFIRFDMEQLTLLLPEGQQEKQWIIEFEMVNHTSNPAAFIAINRSWENKIYETTVNAPNDSVEPGGIEIYEFKEKL